MLTERGSQRYSRRSAASQRKTVGFLQRSGLIFKPPQCRADFLLPCYETTTGGVVMSISTLMVLLLLTFGQSLALSIGFLILWLAGEFDEETDAHRRYSGQQTSTRIARRISEARTAVALRWQRFLRFNWMR